MPSLSLTFCGASRTVTGSKFLVELGAFRMLVDCGLFEGWKEIRQRNWQALPFAPDKLDAVILTHAHLDHSGAVPLVVKQGYVGPVYASPATAALCSILLPDSGFLQEEDAAHANRHGWSRHKPALPLYTAADAQESLKQFQEVDFGKTLSLAGDHVRVKLRHAGHILGAASIAMQTPSGSLFFSGDIGRMADPLTEKPEPPPVADYYVIESTYGARLHEKIDVADRIASVVTRTAARGGTILVPAFAVGRTQTLLYYLYQLRQQQKIPDLPIYMDSPMAISATDIFCNFKKEANGIDTHDFCTIARPVLSREESKALDVQAMPSIIISASGMLTGGRVVHHLKCLIGDARNTVMLTGYQSDGTRGDFLQRGVETIKIHGQEWPVRAAIETIPNLSAHADYEEILGWLAQAPRSPKTVYLVHGSDESLQSLGTKIENAFKWQVKIPSHMQREDLL